MIFLGILAIHVLIIAIPRAVDNTKTPTHKLICKLFRLLAIAGSDFLREISQWTELREINDRLARKTAVFRGKRLQHCLLFSARVFGRIDERQQTEEEVPE